MLFKGDYMKYQGLTDKEVIELRKKYGKNELNKNKKENFLKKIILIICEPMFLMLLISATIYFLLGSPRDGIIMLIFVVGIISIDIIQEWKTDKTIKALKKLSSPQITVLRNNQKVVIDSSLLVPGDIIYIHEGVKIPADGYVIKSNNLKVDESTLTGESINVYKTTDPDLSSNHWLKNYCYQGTLVTGGTGIIKVDKTGSNTEYGKIGTSINRIKEDISPLQKQVNNLVKTCSIIAIILFLLVTILNFINLSSLPLKQRIIESTLSGITLAMAMIPEEFPVVLTVFLSMGAWRLAKKHSLIKKLESIETLGAISVLCVDKTGTITKNQMEITKIYYENCQEKDLIKSMCLCSEEDTYDPMEQAIFNYAKKIGLTKEEIYIGTKIKNYPFLNENKMMASIWKEQEKINLYVKGSPENILKQCHLSKEKLTNINNNIQKMQEEGLRVIAVATKKHLKNENINKELTSQELTILALVGFLDPPKDNLKEYIEICNKAGIKVVVITGDNGLTASKIASTIGIPNPNNILPGNILDTLNDEQLKEQSKDITIYSRVIPEHKMRIVKSYQDKNLIVAMTGDGVNDASSLKQANIGIAMGNRGSEVSKESADLILLDDNFKTIIDTIKDGRRIYDNLKKSISYILTIHIPIAMSSLVASILGVSPTNLMLLPLHIVILELIIDPTCSIILERIPPEDNIMNRPPRNINENILDKDTLVISLLKGITIFLAAFITYYYYLPSNVSLARTMGFIIIVISNIFLVIITASNQKYVYQTIPFLLKDKVITSIHITIIAIILILLYTKINTFLNLTPLSLSNIIISVIISFIATFWYEIVKYIKNNYY